MDPAFGPIGKKKRTKACFADWSLDPQDTTHGKADQCHIICFPLKRCPIGTTQNGKVDRGRVDTDKRWCRHQGACHCGIGGALRMTSAVLEKDSLVRAHTGSQIIFQKSCVSTL